MKIWRHYLYVGEYEIYKSQESKSFLQTVEFKVEEVDLVDER